MTMTAPLPAPRPALPDSTPRWVVEVSHKPGNP
ncbi:MAG: hypothetical protein FD126_415, partial [Elusimicrobia bacterium]